ncbi:hypothetical protein BpHYR1_043650 [Brachionus plicatilis]|uniref:Uncharacterized protein n=1 Tax=Brachionus plicatilis TaxID=10195 RepID=A0A3M7SUE0_BRAPC|nr:hypothetical protein BpHYR1_043650 [Brachionus plicatilis]
MSAASKLLHQQGHQRKKKWKKGEKKEKKVDKNTKSTSQIGTESLKLIRKNIISCYQKTCSLLNYFQST